MFSVAGMTVTMIDSAARMRAMVSSPPEDWQNAARRLWQPMAGMYFFIPRWAGLSRSPRPELRVRTRCREGSDPGAIDTLERADAGPYRASARHGAGGIPGSENPTLTLPDLTVLLVLGDPRNKHFTNEIRGLSAFGGISGYISITIWPTDEVLDRLEGIALHELHHNVRYSPGGVVWSPQTVTVGEHVVAEGLADLFAVDLVGQQGFTHFVSQETRTSDAVLRRVSEGLDVTGMQDFAAWVLGDASARQFGATPVGVPTGWLRSGRPDRQGLPGCHRADCPPRRRWPRRPPRSWRWPCHSWLRNAELADRRRRARGVDCPGTR